MRALQPMNRYIGLIFALGLLLIASPGFAQLSAATADSSETPPTPDEDVPYGVAAGYIVGHKLLREGNVADALPYLHMAYRAQPDVIDIAMDFQAALAAQGYFKDALEVVNSMHTLYPDSMDFLVERVNLNLKIGDTDMALADLRELRNRGHVTFALVDAEASILMVDNKTEQAMDVYRDGLHLLPDEGAKFYLAMSGILQRSKQDESIVPLMDEALAKYPDSPQLWLVKARVQAILGADEAALETVQKADTHFASLAIADAVSEQQGRPSQPALGNNTGAQAPESFVVELADFYAQRRQLDKALGILQPMSDAGELTLSPSLWLGRLLLGTGRTEEGNALVADILVKWPESGRGWFLKGKAAEGSGDWDNALPDYAHAVELAPRDAEIRIGYVRAMLVVWERDLAAAEPDVDQAEKKATFRRHLMVASTIVPEKDSEGQLILGYGFKAVSDFERAAWRFGLAGENQDLRLNALLQKSICHDQRGEEVKARKDLETLNAEYPGHPEIANSLGYFLAEKGLELDKAQVLVEQALAAEPGNGAYLDSMGWIYYRKGDLEPALDYLIRAVNVLPDDPVILEHLGMILQGQGKKVEALDVLRRALAQGGDQVRLQRAIDQLEAGSNEP